MQKTIKKIIKLKKYYQGPRKKGTNSMQATIELSKICEKKRQSESNPWLKEEIFEWTQLYNPKEELDFSLLRLNEGTSEAGKIQKHIY